MAHPSPADASAGYDATARDFQVARERARIGATTVAQWARECPCGAAVLDLGCGTGVPVTEELARAGCEVWGIDASPRLLGMFQERFPQFRSACEDITNSSLFDRSFDAVVAVGVLFLLSAESQRHVIHRVADALVPGGTFLFTAPAAPVSWTDALTTRPSISLGAEAYGRELADAGLLLVSETEDEGSNHYFVARKLIDTAPGAAV